VAFVLVARMKANEGAGKKPPPSSPSCRGVAAGARGRALSPLSRSRGSPRLPVEQYRDHAAFEERDVRHFKEIAVSRLFGLMESREQLFYETF
jgi:hypothetical protein